MSIDLAYPRKVTEYWKRQYLRDLLQDPARVRAGAKMPSLGLSDADAEEVIHFIEKL